MLGNELVRTECLRPVSSLGEKHLRTSLSEFVVHCHSDRNHCGVDNVLLPPLPADCKGTGPIRSRERLGGWLTYHCREGA